MEAGVGRRGCARYNRGVAPRVQNSFMDILYHDGPCLVVLKPAGLATQAPPQFDSLEVRVRNWRRQVEGLTGNMYLGVPHRLDRPVSGPVVFARHVRAAQRISRQFEERTVKKTYWACVQGAVEPAVGAWHDTLLKVYGKPLARVVEQDHPQGKSAVLHYRVLQRCDWGTWLEVELETGRTHQIRVQAASRGWPVLGDLAYGASAPFGAPRDDERLRPIALHGRRLAFAHPMSREWVDVVAPVSEDWNALGLSTAVDA